MPGFTQRMALRRASLCLSHTTLGIPPTMGTPHTTLGIPPSLPTQGGISSLLYPPREAIVPPTHPGRL